MVSIKFGYEQMIGIHDMRVKELGKLIGRMPGYDDPGVFHEVPPFKGIVLDGVKQR